VTTSSRIHPGAQRTTLIDDARADSRTVRSSDGDEISLLGIGTAVLRSRWWAVLGALLLSSVVVAVGVSGRRTYTTWASFVPQAQHGSSPLGSGIAAQFGLSVGGGDPTQSPQFYVDLLSADEILRGLVDSVYTFTTVKGPVSATLVDTFAPSREPRPLRVEETIRRLRDMISASASLKTSVIRFSVTTPYPEMSRQIAERMLNRLNAFNLDNRIAQAATERRFAEARLASVQGELRAAEDRYQDFIQRNREINPSARVSLDIDRLQREVQMRQQLYTALAQEYERARNEELRDTPIIAILERPRASVLPNPRGLFRRAIFGALFGALLAIAIVMLRDYFSDTDDAERGDGAAAQFKSEVRDVWNDLRHPLRALRGKNTRRRDTA
jgi:uncharacterized protein involved in exopolysaccharide biosynthesis